MKRNDNSFDSNELKTQIVKMKVECNCPLLDINQFPFNYAVHDMKQSDNI
jgi:hypothetical protein